jgi:dual specificity tyrosine-phosphorylation-regulated kinase 1
MSSDGLDISGINIQLEPQQAKTLESQDMVQVSPADQEAEGEVKEGVHKEEPEHRDPLSRPIYQLSVKLIDTYKHINKVYYDAKAKKLKEQSVDTAGRTGVKNNGYDNADYDYIIQNDTGEIFHERYIIKHKLGKGSFGQVYCAYDQSGGCEVAIKIIKSRKPFTNQAQIEIELLRHLKDNDASDEMNIVHLLDTFMHHEHQCLVFEMMSYNLYDLLKNTRFKGVSLNLIRKFAKQILKALEYLCRPDINMIHCDLKPENILLKHPRRSAIKLIDFGSSCFFNKKTYSYIQSRFYRSPEILLGTMNYSQKIDMWSLGCVLVEMHTGEPLFGGTDALDQIARVIQIRGPLPMDMLLEGRSENRTKYFTRVDNSEEARQKEQELHAAGGGSMSSGLDDSAPAAETSAESTSNANPESTESIASDAAVKGGTDASSPPKPQILAATDGAGVSYYVKPPTSGDVSKQTASKRSRPLADIIGVYTDGPYGRRKGEVGHSVEDYLMFVDLIEKMLAYNPEDRINPMDALREPFMLATGSSGAAAADAGGGAGAEGVAGSPRDAAAVAAETGGDQTGKPQKMPKLAGGVPFDGEDMETTGDETKSKKVTR